jgi:4-amino-4-deoxy-L-arabinose transferase-like glycosyltransferase
LRAPCHLAIAFAVIAVIALHLVVSLITPFEIHRDELLYLAMGRNLSLFAMDFPPFIAIVAELQRALFGDALWSIRLSPALAHGATVLMSALIAWRLTGGRFAQVVAMTAAATAPLYMRAGTLFQPVVFDQLWWTIALYALVRIAAEDKDDSDLTRHWILFGVSCGVGLLTKFSILFFGVAAALSIVVIRPRWLRTRGPWIATALTLLIGAPSLIGQLRLGFPVLDQMATLRAGQLDRITPAQFLAELVLMQGPASFLLAAGGAGALLASRSLAQWRVVGWTTVLAILVIMGLRGKPYYVGPVFPALYAAGAVILASYLQRISRGPLLHLARAGVLAAIVGWGMAGLPIALPVLRPEPTARFAAATGVTSAVMTNQGLILELPQDFADMLGWERKVARVAAVYDSLPAAEREDAVIVPANYGQAGAIDFYGPRFGLPPARLPLGSYWFWGPGDKPGRVVIKVGNEREDLEEFCGDLTLATRIEEQWVVPEERNVAVWICRDLPRTLHEIWPMFRGRN